MNSNLKQLASLAQSYQVSIQITLLPLMANLHLISLNGHFSRHLEIIPMYQNPPNIYLPQPTKATPFIRLNNGGMPYLLPSANICQHTISDHHTNLSEQNITTYLLFSFHETNIFNLT